MDYEKTVSQTVKGLMILLFAFANSVVLFGIVGAAVGPVLKPEAIQQAEFLRWIALGLPFIELPMAAQIWMTMGKRMDASDDWRQRIAVLRGRTIVVAALFEAPALLAGVVLLLLGPSWHVIPAFVLFLGAVGALVPTRRRVEQIVGGERGARPEKYS